MPEQEAPEVSLAPNNERRRRAGFWAGALLTGVGAYVLLRVHEVANYWLFTANIPLAGAALMFVNSGHVEAPQTEAPPVEAETPPNIGLKLAD